MQKNKLNFLQSSNFWTSVILAIGGLFVGFPQDVGQDLVAQVFALIGSGNLLREYFKESPSTDVGGAVNNSNWWNSIAVIFTSLAPMLPIDLVDRLQDAAVSAISSNWQGIFVAVFSIATIIYNIVQDRKNQEDEPPAPVSLGDTPTKN